MIEMITLIFRWTKIQYSTNPMSYSTGEDDVDDCAALSFISNVNSKPYLLTNNSDLKLKKNKIMLLPSSTMNMFYFKIDSQGNVCDCLFDEYYYVNQR